MDIEASRREFVRGAMVTGAVLGSLGLSSCGEGSSSMASTATSSTSNNTVVVPSPTGSAVVTLDARAADRWTAMIGQTVRVMAESGGAIATVETVVRNAADTTRPDGVRVQGFMVTLLTDRSGAPVGNALYTIERAADGMDHLFLSRGADRGMTAVLFALYN